MSKEQIIKAWKDEAFRRSLSKEQQDQLPRHPAGIIELNEVDLEKVVGGGRITSYGGICTTSLLE